ncbi:MAG: hypothetical protein Q7U78_09190 [Gallionella sp.]|nr:hypothetical protein [Gallionella sp.]
MKLNRHSGTGRNLVQKNTPRSGQNPGLVLLRKISLIDWIPACAGMTVV